MRIGYHNMEHDMTRGRSDVRRDIMWKAESSKPYTDMFHGWVERSFTMESLLWRAEAGPGLMEDLRDRFADAVMDDPDMLREFGYEVIEVPDEVLESPGLLAVGETEDGRHASVSLEYIVASGTYALDVRIGDERARVLMDSRALTDMTEDIKMMRKVVRDHKAEMKERGA